MEVHYYSSKIYEYELPSNPLLADQFNIILASSILHDMCDKNIWIKQKVWKILKCFYQIK